MFYLRLIKILSCRLQSGRAEITVGCVYEVLISLITIISGDSTIGSIVSLISSDNVAYGVGYILE